MKKKWKKKIRSAIKRWERKIRKAVWGLLGLYGLFMLYVLFFGRLSDDLTPVYLSEAQAHGYWQVLQQNLNLIPFQTLKEFGADVVQKRNMSSFAFMNITGNIGAFVPVGWFLPYFRKVCRKFKRFVLLVVVIITCIELLQWFTMTGSCDIDDLILNVMGACIGFGVYKIVEKELLHEKRRKY